jgi:hypothetical protein
VNNDQNFKNLILDYPYDALELFASREASEIKQKARIIPVREEQLKERLGDRFRELDVPLLVEWPDGKREAVLFVLENETDPNRFSIHRLAHYCLDLSDLFKTSRVVPVVIFLQKGSFPDKLVFYGDHQEYLRFTYISFAFKSLGYESYQKSDNIVARLNLPNMNYAPERKVDVYAAAVRGLRRLETETEKIIKYLDYIDIYADLDEHERIVYTQKYPEEEKYMSTFAERFINQGMQQGMQQGEANVLLRQLSRKFGEISEDRKKLIQSADSERLLKWSERVLFADSIDEVLQQ